MRLSFQTFKQRLFPARIAGNANLYMRFEHYIPLRSIRSSGRSWQREV